MQILKEDIRKKIISNARAAFLRCGYSRASMRDIASASGIGVGNIYNYFKSKDDLLQAVVAPAIDELDRMLMTHHNPESPDINILLTLENYESLSVEYISLLRHHRSRLKILFLRAEGSSHGHFIDDYATRASRRVMEWMSAARKLDNSIPVISEFTIHLHSSWELSLLREIIMHDIPNYKIAPVVKDFLVFEIAGWKKLLQLND